MGILKTITRALAVAPLLVPVAWAQEATDWPWPGGVGNAKFSPLDQITPENVANLEVAWEYDMGPEPGRRGYNATPIMIDNIMYFTKDSHGVIAAISAETGEELWTTDMRQLPGVPLETAADNRGISYWPGTDGHGPRIVAGTNTGFLIQLDAATGEVIPGPSGIIDLSEGVMEKFERAWEVRMPPSIYKNLAIMAGRTGEQGRYGIPGDPRAFDLLTGEEVWRFHVVPHPGDENFGTWGVDGWQDRRGPGVWVGATVDEENDLVLIPLGNATDQNYGGHRPGENLYAGTLVALKASTGELVWYFQHAAHDIIDLDTGSTPALIDAYNGEGELVPAVAQMTKQGMLFILDRLTGEPIFETERMPAPPTDAPFDEAWPEQWMTINPPSISRDSMDRNEVFTEISEEHTQYCTDLYDRSVQMGPHTPYGMLPSLVFPGSEGGGSWGGVAANPDLELVFVNTRDAGVIAQLQGRIDDNMPSFGKSKIPTNFFVGPEGYPCQEPPWGELVAVSTRTGDIVWRVPVGEYEELTERGITGTGTATAAGAPITTASGLVFIGAATDAKFRAFDGSSGEELWSADVGINALATPLTYLGEDGNQYVVAVAGGGEAGFTIPAREPGIAKFIAYRLPGEGEE